MNFLAGKLKHVEDVVAVFQLDDVRFVLVVGDLLKVLFVLVGQRERRRDVVVIVLLNKASLAFRHVRNNPVACEAAQVLQVFQLEDAVHWLEQGDFRTQFFAKYVGVGQVGQSQLRLHHVRAPLMTREPC